MRPVISIIRLVDKVRMRHRRSSIYLYPDEARVLAQRLLDSANSQPRVRYRKNNTTL